MIYYCILAYFNNFYFYRYSTLRSNSFPAPWAACVDDRGGRRDKGECCYCAVLWYSCMPSYVAVVCFLSGENESILVSDLNVNKSKDLGSLYTTINTCMILRPCEAIGGPPQ